MGDEAIHLLKRSRIEKKLDAFPRRQLAFAMLTLAPRRASALFRQGVAAFQFQKFLLYGHDWIIERLQRQTMCSGAQGRRRSDSGRSDRKKIGELPGKVDSKLRNRPRRRRYITWRRNRQSSFLEGQSQLVTAHPSRMATLMPPMTNGNAGSSDCHPSRNAVKFAQAIAPLPYRS